MPHGPRPRAAPVPIDLSRPLEELLGGRRAGHRPRPRSVRAQRSLGRASPFAFSQRRELPRADRAHPLHPGGAAAGRDLLRSARRAHGELPDDLGADGAVLPGHLRAGRAGGGSRTWRAGGRARIRHGHGGRWRAARSDRLLPPGGARRAAALPAGAASPAAGAGLGGGHLAAGRRRDPRRAPAARPGPRRRPARGVARGAGRGRRRRLRRLRGALDGSGAGSQGARVRSRPGRLAPAHLRGADRRRRARACCSRPGTPSRWPASSSA